jgi:hypothetical protein
VSGSRGAGCSLLLFGNTCSEPQLCGGALQAAELGRVMQTAEPKHADCKLAHMKHPHHTVYCTCVYDLENDEGPYALKASSTLMRHFLYPRTCLMRCCIPVCPALSCSHPSRLLPSFVRLHDHMPLRHLQGGLAAAERP